MLSEGEPSLVLPPQAEGDISDHLPEPLLRQRKIRGFKSEAVCPVVHDSAAVWLSAEVAVSEGCWHLLTH